MSKYLCKYCGKRVPAERYKLGYDYCTDNLCVGKGIKNFPVVKSGGYVPGSARKSKGYVVVVKSEKELL